MPKCVYCLKDGSVTTFANREHVVPSCLGRFTPINPTIAGDVVCDACNELFNPLETNFFEDSYEGLMGQMLNIEGRNSVTIRGKNIRVEQLAGFGDGFFDGFFVFLKMQDGKFVVDLKDQIKIRGVSDGYYRVFSPAALEAIPDGSSKFAELTAKMARLSRRDISLFGENRVAIDRMIIQLRRFGITYTEREARGHLFVPGDIARVEQNLSCRIDMSIGRVLAKIAFNYFAYCAMQDGRQDVLFGSGFDAIRGFVHDGVGKLKTFIPSITEDPILHEEAQRGTRAVCHLINFLKEDGHIVARMTFFGLPAIYKIVLGILPNDLDDDRFGCGHAFDPFTHRIIGLSQLRIDNPTEDQLRLSFGLLKRTPTPAS